MTISDDDLFAAAQKARAQAHAPYSGFTVGAAALDDQGRTHIGCNVENASFPEGICAEANAIGSMVTAGGKHLVAIAVVGAPVNPEASQFASSGFCKPCGGCRQRILEFADPETRVLMLNEAGDPYTLTIDELLPESFRG